MATGIPTSATATNPLVDVPRDGLRKIGLYGFVISLGSFMFGYDTGVISGALLFITDRFGLNDFQQGAVVSVLLLGAIAGGLGLRRGADGLGRRKTLGLVAITFAAGLAIAALANSFEVLLVGRFVIGFAVGGASALIPTYLSEISPPQIRGGVLSLNQLMIVIGLLISYLVDLAFSGSQDWRAMFWVGVIPALALAVGTFILPESPAWLFNRGKVDRARAEITAVAGTGPAQKAIEYYQREQDERLRATGKTSRRGLRVLTEPRLRAAVVVGLTLAVLQQLGGINTVIYYAPTIMRSTGLSASNAILYSVLIGVINLAMTIVSMRLIDRVGRRKLLLGSLAGMVGSLALLGLSFVVGMSSVISLVFILLYIVSFAVGMGPVFWVLIGEIFPSKDRAAGTSAGSTANWAANFVVSLAFLPLVSAIGQGQTFWLFALVCVFGIWFVGRYVPETKDREFLDIDADLNARWRREAPAHAGSSAPAGDRRAT